MTNHTPSLETCQRLKDAGFPQQGAEFYWHIRTLKHAGKTPAREGIAAPLLTEILDNLPFGKTVWQGDENYFVSLSDGYGSHDQTVEHNNPAEAAALLYLALKEQS